MILSLSLAAAIAHAGQPGRSPAVIGPAVVAEVPNPANNFKQQAAQVIGKNSINDQLTIKQNQDPAVNRTVPTPKREPAVASMSGASSGEPSIDVH